MTLAGARRARRFPTNATTVAAASRCARVAERDAAGVPSRNALIPSRGADDPFSQELLAGLEAYSRDDLGLSVLLLDKAQVTGQLETLRRLYLGSALARQGEYVRAARLLRNMAITELPDPWSMEGRWTLYVALKGSGETTAADSLLTVLRQDAGELGARARAVNPS